MDYLKKHRRSTFILAGLVITLALVASVISLEFLVAPSKIEQAIFPTAVSVELSGVPSVGSKDARVATWLSANRSVIVAAERRFSVDRRAIAGLIAYEAIANVHISQYGGLVRWSGPGKVHYKENRITEGDPVAKQIEDLGFLPRRSLLQRRMALAQPKWAALYIAAIMRALSDTVRRGDKRNIRCNPGALVTLASAWDIISARRYFSTLGTAAPFAYNFPGNWVTSRLLYLQRAVGKPDRSVCHRVSSAPETRHRRRIA